MVLNFGTGFDEIGRSLNKGATYLYEALCGKAPDMVREPELGLVVPPMLHGGIITSRAVTHSPLLHLSKLIQDQKPRGKPSSTQESGSELDSKSDSIKTTNMNTITSHVSTSSGNRHVSTSAIKPGQRMDLGTVETRVGRQTDNKTIGAIDLISSGRKGGYL